MVADSSPRGGRMTRSCGAMILFCSARFDSFPGRRAHMSKTDLALAYVAVSGAYIEPLGAGFNFQS